ncbi:hypothetical protein KUA47_02780 [Prevotella copri]|nr:hypothetical protein [Segatella copri]MBW0036437.1 hypothetical protein [Segatella copri]
MDKTTTQITMLGTGNATVSQIYNTCFVLQTPSTLMLVEELGVKNLVLYHTEEKTFANRKENYTREAAENFKGRIFVPDDLEVIEL